MRFVLTILCLLLFVLPAAALELPGRCTVHFIGTSTLHDFEGEGTCQPFVLDLNADGMLHPADLNVPVAGIRTGIDGRDEKMREMFDADRFPLIVGSLASAPVAQLHEQLQQASENQSGFPFVLKIRDQESTVDAKVTQLVDNEKTLSFDLEFPVSLKDYQLEPPSVLGFIRVGDEVRVRVSLHLAPLPVQR